MHALSVFNNLHALQICIVHGASLRLAPPKSYLLQGFAGGATWDDLKNFFLTLEALGFAFMQHQDQKSIFAFVLAMNKQAQTS